MYPNLPRGVTSMTSDEASQKLELFISARNLADLDFITVTDSFLVIKLQQTNKPQKTILQTKVYWNDLYPNYAETVTLEYFFEIRQKLKFQVFHEANPPKLVGKVQTSLGQIFGSPNNGLTRDLLDNKNKKSGQIIVRCEKIEQTTNKMLQFNLQGSDFPQAFSFLCFGSNSDTFFRIFRIRSNDELLIYESQVKYGTTSPLFNTCKLSQRRLCKNKPDDKFQIRLYSYAESGRHSQIGRASSTVHQLLEPKTYPILDNNQKRKGNIRFGNVKRYIKSTFTDYLVAGLQLMLITCIDFTASNGSSKSPNSLHYISPNKKSTYEEALEQVSQILLDYDYDKQVPVYGFGAKVSMPTYNSNNQTDHCFPLNGNQDNSHVFMVQGIMQAYRTAIQYLEFSGPTYFNQILSSAIQQCHQIKKQTNQINQYMIVFILTDGQIHDKQQVIDQIIQCCSLPISIIIVGVGNGPFDIMNQIDDDNCQLISSRGIKTTRDLVQFVQFQKFRNNGVQLAKEVLEELPRQVQQYFQIMNIGPDKLKQYQPPQIHMPINNASRMGVNSRGPYQQVPYFAPSNPYGK